MAKILVVEDMESVVDLLKTLLGREGFQVAVAHDGTEALDAVRREKPDLMLLDLILPGLDGLEVLQRIRQDPITAHLPIIILSGKEEERDKVIGLEIGADDYVTKPFHANELIARVKNRLRRSVPTDPARTLRVGNLEMQLDRYTVTLSGKPIHLTSKEFSLLRALLMSNGRVLSRDALFESVWGASKDADLQSRTIDVHIRSLRNKLGPVGQRIFTVRNVGYRLDPTLPE
ncbi:MAG TPA: response regulator transcription factor [Nitrospira sp.]|nr:response regulator transcription factor [Nitrospira sp.]